MNGCDCRVCRAMAAQADSAACWPWNGHVKPNGYGTVRVSGCSGHVHRIAYEHAIGPIPEGMVLDHLCRNRACFNPTHVEPVTQAENLRRGLNGVLKTHCSQGHELTPDNVWVPPTQPTRRRCKQCLRAYKERTLGRAIGAVVNPKLGPDHPLVHEAAALYVAGLSTCEIAEKYGVSVATARRRVLLAGVPLRSRAEAQIARAQKAGIR